MKIFIVVIVACAALTQWIEGAPQGELDLVEQVRNQTASSSHAIEEFGKTMNDFTQDFLTEVWKDEGDNFVFSPFSLHAALAVCTSGATENSNTYHDLLNSLGRVQNIQAHETRYNLLLKAYEDPAIQELLIFGTRFWSAQGYQNRIEEPFQKLLKQTYRSELTELGSNPTEEINNWVKEKTKGKIDHIMDQVSGDAKFLIVNALYFNGAWTKTFNDLPDHQDFTYPDGSKTKIPMLVRNESRHNSAAVFETELRPNVRFTAVSIPYEDQGNIDQFEMVIIMPEDHRELLFLQSAMNKSRDIPHSENIFDVAQKALDNQFRSKKTIIMPKFSIDSKVDVAKYLKRMNIEAPFSEGGFEKILADEPLKVSQILHRAIIEVTKDGTVGAAATAIEFVPLFADFGAPEVITINKPFIFFLQDRIQKTIIFAGKFGGPARK